MWSGEGVFDRAKTDLSDNRKAAGEKAGVSGTPTLFVDGERFRPRPLGWLYVVGGLLGFAAALVFGWAQAGATFGVVFVHRLLVAGLYDIHTLCPYCLVVWWCR